MGFLFNGSKILNLFISYFNVPQTDNSFFSSVLQKENNCKPLPTKIPSLHFSIFTLFLICHLLDTVRSSDTFSQCFRISFIWLQADQL